MGAARGEPGERARPCAAGSRASASVGARHERPAVGHQVGLLPHAHPHHDVGVDPLERGLSSAAVDEPGQRCELGVICSPRVVVVSPLATPQPTTAAVSIWLPAAATAARSPGYRLHIGRVAHRQDPEPGGPAGAEAPSRSAASASARAWSLGGAARQRVAEVELLVGRRPSRRPAGPPRPGRRPGSRAAASAPAGGPGDRHRGHHHGRRHHPRHDRGAGATGGAVGPRRPAGCASGRGPRSTAVGGRRSRTGSSTR